MKCFLRFILLWTCLIVLPMQTLATSWAYPFVVWDDYIYIVSDEYVTEVDKEIGHVTSYSDMEQYGGNFSNMFQKGTKYYSIEGISTDIAIAVEAGEGKYKRADRGAEYTFKGTTDYTSIVMIALFVLFLVTLAGIYFMKRRG